VGIAHDTPGAEGDERLGGGPLVVVYDATAIPNRALLDLVTDTAKRLRLPLQFEAVERGGTDAGRIHLNGQGVPTISMGVRRATSTATSASSAAGTSRRP
jgi:Cellulase M and related proteins